MEEGPAPEKTDAVLPVLYLFCGVPRQADINSCLKTLSNKESFTLELKEVDIERSSADDLSSDSLWEQLIGEVRDGLWDVVILRHLATPSVELVVSGDLIQAHGLCEAKRFRGDFLGCRIHITSWCNSITIPSGNALRLARLHYRHVRFSCWNTQKTWGPSEKRFLQAYGN